MCLDILDVVAFVGDHVGQFEEVEVPFLSGDELVRSDIGDTSPVVYVCVYAYVVELVGGT